MRHLSYLLVGLGLMAGLAGPAQAQDDPSRFGLGLHVLGSTASGNVGPGLHFRASSALNSDVSLALGSGLAGFIFRGRDDAAFALDPQVSAIVSFSTSNTQNLYVIGGGGAYVPFGSTDTESGPTFNVGLGRAWRLNESSIYAEFNPGFLVGEEKTTLVLPIRVGVIL
ncbi:MAG: hypothetical protein BRD33_00085 [Bacteroidetes bacterium QH_6_63_17]|nr:MAG: hypothetical protein BRD33_00085 [Bacteroidetes bacterium QH_6_63_17]